MSDWTSGYVAEIGYTYGYYNALNPNLATLPLLHAGYLPPSSGVHCELGYGQGLSVNIHAAASGSTWYGADFNPSQAAFAQSLAIASGADAHLTDEAFADFCNRSDLPDFDTIGLHGIWSWISDENRQVIVDFIRRKLKVGGALYISYNTLPGWASFAPMRHLMTEHASVLGSTGQGVVGRVEGAIEFVHKILDTNPIFSRTNPTVIDRLKKVSEQKKHYLAHEYFNKDWHPMYFALVNQWLSSAKVSFACSANHLDHIDAINLSADQKNLLLDITDNTFKETVRDFILNQQFRRDYWVKGLRKLSTIEQAESIKKHRLVLISCRDNVPLNITGALGEVKLTDSIYVPILDLMSDHKITSIEELAVNVAVKEISLSQVIQVVMALSGSGHISSVQTDEQIGNSKLKAQKLNQALIEKARFSDDITFLASPLTGGGIEVNRFEQLFLLSIIQGKTLPEEWARSAWSALSLMNQKLVKDGKAIDSDEENLQELMLRSQTFESKRLPILKALQVV